MIRMLLDEAVAAGARREYRMRARRTPATATTTSRPHAFSES
jgi:hypothetical protein